MRSTGVTIFGIIFLIIGLLGIAMGFWYLSNTPSESQFNVLAHKEWNADQISSLKTAVKFAPYRSFFSGAISVLLGWGVLRLKEISRKAVIYLSVLSIALFVVFNYKNLFTVSFGGWINVIFAISCIYFFTLFTVKEQFN